MPGRRSYVSAKEPLNEKQRRRRDRDAYYRTSHSANGLKFVEVPKRVATDVKDLVRGKMVHHTTIAHHWSAAPDHASSHRDCWDPCDDPWAYDDPWRKKSSNNTRLPLPSGASIAGMKSEVIEQFC